MVISDQARRWTSSRPAASKVSRRRVRAASGYGVLADDMLLVADWLKVNLVSHPAIGTRPVIWNLDPSRARWEALTGMSRLLVVRITAYWAAEGAHAMPDSMAGCDWGRAWPSSSRMQGAAFGGAKGKPEDKEMRSATRVIQACAVVESGICAPVAGEHSAPRPRLDVGAAEVARVVVDQAAIHYPAPGRREPGEHDHPRVTGRQLRRRVGVAQRLVAAGRVGVVVAVALQVVEEDVGGDVVAVPGVLGAAALVAAVGLLRAHQAVVREVVDDLEHYGLMRQKKDDGRYERCRAEHSWNSNNVASNVLLYHLQRHSDHHANPTRRYQALRHVDEAPQLPTGYAGMIVLAWFPPVWRRVMDRRLVDHYAGDLSRANIQPRAKRRMLARYGSADA